MQRYRIPRIVVGLCLLAGALVCGHLLDRETLSFWLSLAALIVGGIDVIFSAVRNLFQGYVFDENFLMSIAAIGAFFIGEGAEGAAVMLFYQIGEYFQDRAVDSARKSIGDLMDIRPDYANLMVDGQPVKCDPYDVKVGDVIIVRPGEKIPLDGTVLEGSSALDTAALTGESVPRNVKAGDEVLSGCINVNGMLTVSVGKEFSESTASKILDLVENAAANKSKTESFITRFARIYTPIVTFCAVALAVIPGLATGDWSTWIYRALSFLVVSCPCALVISVPMSFFGGIGAASRHGVLVKGSNYLEALARAEIVVMDKTGTLTHGSFSVQTVVPADGLSEEELLALAAAAEQYSSHPIAQSLLDAAGRARALPEVEEISEHAGHGVSALIDGHRILVGNSKLLAQENIAIPAYTATGTIVHIAVDARYAGYISIADAVKSDAAEAIDKLHQAGVSRVVMLTGDRQPVAQEIAQRLGIDEYRAELLPDGKVREVEALLGEKRGEKSSLIFVGDGINDAPVLARADVGIAMGALGSDAAVEAADVVLMDDAPSKIAEAIHIARATLINAQQNIVFSLAVKLLFLLLIGFGITNMWMAVFADVGVALLAILNAMRVLKL